VWRLKAVPYFLCIHSAGGNVGAARMNLTGLRPGPMSPARRRGSILQSWIPAFAGMTYNTNSYTLNLRVKDKNIVVAMSKQKPSDESFML